MNYEFDRSFVTDVPPDKVYEYLTNIPASREWTDAESVELFDDGPVQVGSRWRSIGSSLFGGARSEESEAIALVPGSVIRLKTSSDAKGVKTTLDCTFTLAPVDHGTRVNYREEAIAVQELQGSTDKVGLLPGFRGPAAWAGDRAVLIRHRLKLLREALESRREAGTVVHRTSSRGWLFAGGLLQLAFGTFPIAVVLYLVLPGVVSGTVGWEGLLYLMVSPFAILFWFAHKALLQEVYQVRIDSNGALTFKKVFGTTRISASDVVRIEAGVARLGVEDADNRQVWVVHKRGKVLIPGYSPRVEQILSELTRLNPHVKINRGLS